MTATVAELFRAGAALTPLDFAGLEQSYITPAVADSAGLFRVASHEAKQMFGQGGSEDFAGIVFPYHWPGEPGCIAHRLRRDNPPITVKNGVRKEERKYMSAPGWGNRPYFHPDTPPAALTDTSVSFAITEGQKKCLALWRLAQESSPDGAPLFVPIGLNGVWGFRGITGKTTNARGERVSEKGVINDFDRIAWTGRRVYIVFDTNVKTNEAVAAARRELGRELEDRGADVLLVDIPAEDGINGIDDYLGRHGAQAGLALFSGAERFDAAREDTNVAELANEITAADHFAVDPGGKLYVWQDGVYKPKGEAFIHTRVKALYLTWKLAHAWTSRKSKEVVEFIRVDAPRLWDEPPGDVVNLANGLLDLRTRILHPHSPDHLSPIQLPVSYDPAARCPAWDKFTAEVFPEDSEAIAWEIPAWLMTPDRNIQKAVLLLGEGSNGKSTYLRGVTAFVGKHNTAALSLHKIEQDRFAAARLVGKLANICPDLPTAHLASTMSFKALTGGDVLSAEFKFCDSFECLPFAKLVFSANKPPQSDDATHGFFRRWQVVPFTRSFEDGAKGTIRPEVLDAQLSAPEELSGLLNKALDALRTIRRSGFTQSPSMQQAWDEFRTATDPLAVWLDTRTVALPNVQILTSDLLSAFNRHLFDLGKQPMTKTAFGLALRRIRPGLEPKQRTHMGRERQWVYVGIALKTEQQLTEVTE